MRTPPVQQRDALRRLRQELAVLPVHDDGIAEVSRDLRDLETGIRRVAAVIEEVSNLVRLEGLQ